MPRILISAKWRSLAALQSLNGALVNRALEFIEKTRTKHFGFYPDMSMFTKRPPEGVINSLMEQGGRENILRYVVQAYQNKLGPDKTVAEVKKMGDNEVELEWASTAGIYHYSWNDPKVLTKILPYSYHFHTRFWTMKDDFTEESIPYEDVLPVIVKSGYDWWYSSEFEGFHNYPPPFAASKSLRKQHFMIRKLLEKI